MSALVPQVTTNVYFGDLPFATAASLNHDFGESPELPITVRLRQDGGIRFASDDGTFGVVITPSRRAPTADYFRFQLVIDGEIFGDEDPSILGSAMGRLLDIGQVDDLRLSQPEIDPGAALTHAMNDETVELHDRVVFANAESLDRWQVVTYQREGDVIWLVRPRATGARTSIAMVPAGDYFEIVDLATKYWNAQLRR